MVSCGNDEGDACEGEEGGRGLSSSCLESGFGKVETGSCEGHAEDEEDVGQDGAKHGSLDKTELILVQGGDTDNELDSVSEAGCQLGSMTQQTWRSRDHPKSGRDPWKAAQCCHL